MAQQMKVTIIVRTAIAEIEHAKGEALHRNAVVTISVGQRIFSFFLNTSRRFFDDLNGHGALGHKLVSLCVIGQHERRIQKKGRRQKNTLIPSISKRPPPPETEIVETRSIRTESLGGTGKALFGKRKKGPEMCPKRSTSQ